MAPPAVGVGTLRRLAELETDGRPVLSVYLDLDPTRGDWGVAVLGRQAARLFRGGPRALVEFAAFDQERAARSPKRARGAPAARSKPVSSVPTRGSLPRVCFAPTAVKRSTTWWLLRRSRACR
jgi:hypothetical protein